MIYSLSVDWRLEWSVRTCISTAVISFLALYEGTNATFSLEFAAFVCILVKDRNFGATVKNGLACLLSSAILTSICWILIVLINVDNPILFLFIAVVLTYFFQYIGKLKENYLVIRTCILLHLKDYFLLIEFHLMGKKLAISLLALNLISQSKPSPLAAITLFMQVAIGVGNRFHLCNDPALRKLCNLNISIILIQQVAHSSEQSYRIQVWQVQS